MTPEERAARSTMFREALRDGVIFETFEEIEGQFVEQWKACLDAHERDNLWRSVHILRLLRQHMANISHDNRIQSADVTAIRRAK